MKAKKIFNAVYKQEYFEGYARGMNPLPQAESCERSEAFNSGFAVGRMDYEEMNGSIKEGIPPRILTNKALEEFLLSGLLGLSIERNGYTDHQYNIIEKWYQSGIEKFDPDQSFYLFEILQENGILLS